jgi:hypothetical protein
MYCCLTFFNRWVDQGGRDCTTDDLKDFSTGQKCILAPPLLLMLALSPNYIIVTFLDQLQSLTLSNPFENSVLEALDKFPFSNFLHFLFIFDLKEIIHSLNQKMQNYVFGGMCSASEQIIQLSSPTSLSF